MPNVRFTFVSRRHGLLCLLAIGTLLGGALTAAEVEFPAQVQPGNIFTVGETVEVKAAIQSGSDVRWAVSDFTGKPLVSGAGPVVKRAVVIAPKVKETGYYVLQIEALRGAATVGVGRTTFAVVPRFHIARMAGSRYGVMTHFATGMPLDDRLLAVLEKGGIAWIRDEQPWDALEKTRGHYDFPRQDTAYMEAAKKADMNVLFDASFGNELYDGQPGVKVYKLAPYTPEGYSGYANYCAAVLGRYGSSAPRHRNLERIQRHVLRRCRRAGSTEALHRVAQGSLRQGQGGPARRAGARRRGGEDSHSLPGKTLQARRAGLPGRHRRASLPDAGDRRALAHGPGGAHPQVQRGKVEADLGHGMRRLARRHPRPCGGRFSSRAHDGARIHLPGSPAHHLVSRARLPRISQHGASCTRTRIACRRVSLL